MSDLQFILNWVSGIMSNWSSAVILAVVGVSLVSLFISGRK